MTIKAILFDADGVIQQQVVEFHSALSEVLGSPRDNIDQFLRDVFNVEYPALTGQRDFAQGLTEVFLKWQCRGTVQQALRAWASIRVDDAVIDLINTLRASGKYCFLATNQIHHRARYMSETLGYRDLFDKEFYSCALGYMKPDTNYFRAILKEISFSPSEVLFIDDLEANIIGARKVGLNASVFPTGPDVNRHTVMCDLLAQYDVHVA